MTRTLDKETLGIGFVVMIDNAILDAVKVLQQNAYAINKISKDEFIALYLSYGIHQLDFDKIFKG